jgi:hypothetical protein
MDGEERVGSGQRPAANGYNGNGLANNGHAGNGRPSSEPINGAPAFKDNVYTLLEDDTTDWQTDEVAFLPRPGPLPQTREVSLADLRRGRAPAPEPTPAPPAPATAGRSTLSFAALADWVTESMRKAGRALTLKAIDTYAATGQLSAEAEGMLTQLMMLAGDEEPAEPVSPTSVIELLAKLDQIVRDGPVGQPLRQGR